MQKSINKVFTEIYQTNKWTNGSGPGSIRVFNEPFLRYIKSFLEEKSIASIVDIGCGDFQLWQDFDFGTTHYIGLDLVESVIERNKRIYSRNGINFQKMPASAEGLPDADLFIVKDVLIHLDNQTSLDLISTSVAKSRFCVAVNNIGSEPREYNRDINIGDFRPVDISRKPFNLSVIDRLQYGVAYAYDPRLPRLLARVLRRRVWPGVKHIQVVAGKRII